MSSPASKKIVIKGNTANLYNLLESCRIREKNSSDNITHTS